MLKRCIFGVGCYILLCGVSAERNDMNKEIPLLDKFHQNDYQMNYHRLELVRFNKDYMEFVHVVTYKYNRTCQLSNITLKYLVDVGTDMQVITQSYKFASNEYRLFPIRFQVNFCEAWHKNIGGIADISKCGNFKTCSPSKGINYTACMWTMNASRCPPFIPDGDYKLEHEFVYRATELFVLDAYATVFRPIL